jgi:hypothetical protein
VPVERALARIETRFRGSQNADGGWSYMNFTPPPNVAQFPVQPGVGSTATMTCAGVLALAIVDGAAIELGKERDPDAKPIRDVSKDVPLKGGLQALSTVIDNPQGPHLRRGEKPIVPRIGGRTYYFLWSLERAAVALDLKTIGNKDWYGWGAEILLGNQLEDGSWAGGYGDSGVDTCFALLFLKRANLARDLTAHLRGKMKDPGRVIRAGGIGGNNLRNGKMRLKSALESKDDKPITKPVKPAENASDPETGRISSNLVKATGAERDKLLESIRDSKGVKFTVALAEAIPRLEGESHRKARQALADRLTRMKAETLGSYLEDEDAEIRRAAALAGAMKESKLLIPNLIPLLRDPETHVVRAAHAALKSLTDQDFGPALNASREDRDLAVRKWFEWWAKQRK